MQYLVYLLGTEAQCLSWTLVEFAGHLIELCL